jgi:large subunit ribosomal protein L23
MALFGKKEEKKTAKKVTKKVAKKPAAKKEKKKEAAPVKPKKTTSADLSWVLISPRVTEKSAIQSEDKIYVFNVHVDSNKLQIKEAIQKKFEVTPTKINVVKLPPQPVFRKGVHGKKAQAKKAYVHLNKKDNIQFV